MKSIAFFSIPAHGHTNPMIGAARALVRRGNRVRFYSFEPFREKIQAAGAEFVPCDPFLPPLDRETEARLKRVSTTEMTIQDLRITAAMTPFLEAEVREFRPDVIYTDAVCFWGKLTAQKFAIPMVVSTSTFAFNQLSSRYMRQSLREMADPILGMPRVNRELKKLEPLGYRPKGILSLVMNDNATDTVVYTSRTFQPFGGTFSDHYAFVGPSLLTETEPDKEKARPLIYISLGTVMNERPEFYSACIGALGDLDADVVISCGRVPELGTVPDNIRLYDRVDQPEVLARADVFLTHCGMNSVSESLYMAAPMVLWPQTQEQYAVARRTEEAGAGVFLKDPSRIREAVTKVLEDNSFATAAAKCSRDLRAAGGPEAAAEFIENAPHPASPDPIRALNQKAFPWQTLYWLLAIGLSFLVPHGWIIAVAAGILNGKFSGWLMEKLAVDSE